MRKTALTFIAFLLSIAVLPSAAHAQGYDPCTEKTFNALVSWAKKKDVQSFSSRLLISSPIAGDKIEFWTQKLDPEYPESLKTISMKKAGIVKELKTKNSDIWTFFNVQLPAAKYTRMEESEVGCYLIGSLSDAWEVSFRIHTGLEGGWKIGAFGYQKVVKTTEDGGNTEEGSGDTENTQ